MAQINVKGGSVGFDFDIHSEDLQPLIDKNIELINEHAETLKMMAIADPKTFIDSNEDVIYSIKNRVDDEIESIGYLERQIAEYNIAEELIADWKYSCNMGQDEILNPSDKNDFKKIVYHNNSDSYSSPKTDKKTLSIRNYDTLNEYIDDCVTDLHNETIDYTGGTWIIKFDGKLVVTPNRRFTYLTEKDARNAFISFLNIVHGFNMFSPRYIKENQSFIKSIHDALDFDKEAQNNFDNLITEMSANDYKYDMDKSIKLSQIFEDIIFYRLKDRVKFINIA